MIVDCCSMVDTDTATVDIEHQQHKDMNNMA